MNGPASDYIVRWRERWMGIAFDRRRIFSTYAEATTFTDHLRIDRPYASNIRVFEQTVKLVNPWESQEEWRLHGDPRNRRRFP